MGPGSGSKRGGRETVADRRERASRIANRLADLWPDADCELDYASAWQLLIATILSAQCTDKMVNEVTPGLFDRYPDPVSLAKAPQRSVEKLIRRTGFFSQKTRAIRECARTIADEHDGQVPESFDALVRLKGVGRKTASVVVGTAFGQPAVFVDTHVKRLVGRFGLTRKGKPEEIEQELKRLLPAEEWTAFCHRTIHHGRRVCHARKPMCEGCGLADLCPRIGLQN